MSKLTKGLFLSPEKAKAVHRAIKGYARDLAMAEEPRIQKPANDPVIKAVRKARRDADRAFRKTYLGKLQALEAEQTRWKRKWTIASNKLNSVRVKINAVCVEMATKLDGGKS